MGAREQQRELEFRQNVAVLREQLLAAWRARQHSEMDVLRVLLALQTYEREEAPRVAARTTVPAPSAAMILQDLRKRLAPDLAAMLGESGARPAGAAAAAAAPPPAPPVSTGAEVRERFGVRKEPRWLDRPELPAPSTAAGEAAVAAAAAPSASDDAAAAAVPAAATAAALPLAISVPREASSLLGPGQPGTIAALPPAREAAAPAATPVTAPAPRRPAVSERATSEWGRILETLREAGSTAVLLGVATVLVIGGSLMLTLSFWDKVRIAPLLASLGVTTLFFLAGWVLRRRLRVLRTGNTLLAIAMLLVPLNILAGRFVGADLLVVLPVLAALLAVVWLAGRQLFERLWAFPVANLAAASTLLAFLPRDAAGHATAAVLPVILYGASMLAELLRRRRLDPYARRGLEALLSFLLCSYAWSFLPLEAMNDELLALPATVNTVLLLIAAMPALWFGGYLTKLGDASPPMRATGVAMVLGGALAIALVSLVTDAQPWPLLTWSAATVVTMTLAVRLTGLELLHLGSVIAGTAGWVTLVHMVAGWGSGSFSWRVPRWEVTSLWCIPLSLLLAMLSARSPAGGLTRRILGIAAMAWAGLILATAWRSSDTAAWCLGIYGVLALVLVRLGSTPALAVLSPALLAFSSFLGWHSLAYPGRLIEPWLEGAVLGTLALVFSAGSRPITAALLSGSSRTDGDRTSLAGALRVMACIIAGCAAFFTVAMSLDRDGPQAPDLVPGALALLAVMAAVAQSGSSAQLILAAVLMHLELALALLVFLPDEDVGVHALAMAALALLTTASARAVARQLPARAPSPQRSWRPALFGVSVGTWVEGGAAARERAAVRAADREAIQAAARAAMGFGSAAGGEPVPALRGSVAAGDLESPDSVSAAAVTGDTSAAPALTGAGLQLVRFTTVMALLATLLAIIGMGVAGLRGVETVTGTLVVATLGAAAYLSVQRWRSYLAFAGIFFTALHAYGLNAGLSHLWIGDPGFRSATLGIASAMVMGGLALRSFPRLRRLFAEPALVTSVLACIAPLLGVLEPSFELSLRGPEAIDAGMFYVVAGLISIAGYGLASAALPRLAALLLVLGAAVSGWVAGNALGTEELLVRVAGNAQVGSFLLVLAAFLWRPQGGYRQVLREALHDIGGACLVVLTATAIAVVAFLLAPMLWEGGGQLLVRRTSAVTLLVSLVLGAIPLERAGDTASWGSGLLARMRMVSLIAAVLWAQVVLRGEASVTYTQLAAAGVVGLLAIAVSWRKRDDLLGLLGVMSVLTVMLGFLDPWSFPTAGSWGLLAGLLLLASRSQAQAGNVYAAGSLLLAMAVASLGGRLVELAPVTYVGALVRWLAVVPALGIATLARPWSWIAGRRPEAVTMAAVYAGITVTAAILAGIGLIDQGDAAVRQLPVLLRVALPLVLAAMSGVIFFTAHRRQNESTVYAGLAVVALAATSVRLSLPELFGHGFFKRWWPYLSIGIGWLASGVASWMERAQASIFVRPFRQVGALLPLVPLFGIWFVPPDLSGATSLAAIAELRADQAHSRMLVLVTLSVFYFALGAVQQRRGLMMLGTLCANLALWNLWGSWQLEFRDLPQLFAIPVGLTVLLAAHVQRSELGEERARHLTYFGLLIIYMSSAWKLFAVGGYHSLFMAALSVAGIVVGLAMRLRPVVMTGLAFLAAVLVTELTRAAREHPWLWWAFGITTGIAILAFVGWNESKKRGEKEQPG